VFSYYRMCPLTIECVLLLQVTKDERAAEEEALLNNRMQELRDTLASLRHLVDYLHSLKKGACKHRSRICP